MEVTSKHIKDIVYNEEEKTLFVTFHVGGKYRYEKGNFPLYKK